MKTTKIAAAYLALALTPAHAMNVGTPTTFSKLFWSATFTAPGLQGCQQLVFDATGDLANSDTLAMAGALNCGGGAYGMSGNLYVGETMTLNITMLIAGYTISCPRITSWVGTCAVYDAAWIQRGTGLISLLP